MNQEPIIVFASWLAKEGQLDNVLTLLAGVAKESRAEEGNLFYTIHQNNADKNAIVLYEGYKDEAALAAHRNSEHFQNTVIGKIVPMLEDRQVVLATLMDSI